MDKDTVTLWGAVIAAIAGVLNLLWQFSDRNDRYVLNCGPLSPQTAPGEYLFVVNVGKHPITLADYGFLREPSNAFSIPDNHANDWEPGHRFQLLGTLSPREHGEAGVHFAIKCIGAYAISTTQRFPRVAFHFEVPWYTRCWVWARMIYLGRRALF